MGAIPNSSEKLCAFDKVLEHIIIDLDRIHTRQVRAVPDGGRDVFLLRRIRPEWWRGILRLWHFWAIAALSLALAWSVWRDRRELRTKPGARWASGQGDLACSGPGGAVPGTGLLPPREHASP